MTTVYWAGIAVCAILSLILGYFTVKRVYLLYTGAAVSEFLELMASVSVIAQAVLMNLIGLVMIASVIKISRFMSTLPRHQRIDVSSLLTHSGAFGLFMLSQLAQASAWTYWVIQRTQKA